MDKVITICAKVKSFWVTLYIYGYYDLTIPNHHHFWFFPHSILLNLKFFGSWGSSKFHFDSYLMVEYNICILGIFDIITKSHQELITEHCFNSLPFLISINLISSSQPNINTSGCNHIVNETLVFFCLLSQNISRSC